MIKGRCFSLRKLDGQQIIYPSYIQIWLKILIIIFLDKNSHLVRKKFKIFFEFFIISLHIAPKPKGVLKMAIAIQPSTSLQVRSSRSGEKIWMDVHVTMYSVIN